MESLLSTFSKKVRRALIVFFLFSSILILGVSVSVDTEESVIVFFGYLILLWPFVFLINWVRKAEDK